MKRVILLVVVAALLLPALAVAQDSYVELLRQDIRTKKVEVFTAVLDMTDEEAAAFWPVYRKYELDMSAIGDKRVANIKNFAMNYDTLNNAQASEILASAFSIRGEQLKLQEKYSKEFGKVLPATTVARFFQIEFFINDLIDVQIASEMPLAETVREAAAAAKGGKD